MGRALRRSQSFEDFVPLVGWFVLKLGECFDVHEIRAGFDAAKERSKVILVRFFVRVGESVAELSDKVTDLVLEASKLVLDQLLAEQLLLDLAVELAINEDASPVDLVRVEIGTLAVHEIVAPVALVRRAVGIHHLAETGHDTFLPRARVDVATGELVGSFSMHLIFLPVAVVLLDAH